MKPKRESHRKNENPNEYETCLYEKRAKSQFQRSNAFLVLIIHEGAYMYQVKNIFFSILESSTNWIKKID